ncbi:MAG: hypothetical protein ACXIUB_01405 [Wenzhouxiangella sp.]
MSRKSAKKTMPAWWEQAEIPVGQQWQVTLGTLELTLARTHDEWVLHSSSLEEDEASRQPQYRLSKGQPDNPKAERFVHSGDGHKVSLQPRLADRPVVIRPRQPVALLSGQQITLYLSTPVWIDIMVGEPPLLLKSLPAQRLSDTWFGPNTREGELCYSGRTHARHDPKDLPDRPHRAITPLTIQNRATSPLPIEKISLPVPWLALYGDQTGRLWTQSVTMTRDSETDLASVRVDSREQADGKTFTRLAEPRQAAQRNNMIRAVSAWLGS